MNKINELTQKYILETLDVANSLGIDALLFEQTNIRGSIKEKGILVTRTLAKELDIPNMAITRASTLKARLNILDGSGELQYEPKVKDNGDSIVKKLIIKKGKTKVDFGCGDPAFLKIPKAINDEVCFSFIVTQDTMQLLQKISRAMTSELVIFTNNGSSDVTLKTTDAEGDTLSHVVDSNCKIYDSAAKDTFSSQYSLKILLNIFQDIMRTSGNITCNITKRGILKMQLNGFDIYIFSEI